MYSMNNTYQHCPYLDFDECASDTDNCSQKCSDTLGSYQCVCYDGYILDSDNHTCNGQCQF